MSRLHWMASVLALAAIAAPATAHAAVPATAGPEATVETFVAAAQARDARRACAIVDLPTDDARRACRFVVRSPLGPILRARLEPGVVVRGRRARAVVAFVAASPYASNMPVASRNRVLLRRGAGHWRIVSGGLPEQEAWDDDRRDVDPVAPGADAAALRRLADDQLLMLSGNPGMACALLAPGAPLGGTGGACADVGLATAVTRAGIAARVERVAVHRSGPDRARVAFTASVHEAVRGKGKGQFRLRAKRWTDTLQAIRSGGRWRLAKLSRKAYDVLGVPAPSDVASPAPTATWPFADAPSVSERPVPTGCRTPPLLWAGECEEIWTLAGGDGTLAWNDGFWRAGARAVAAGVPLGPVATVSEATAADRKIWFVRGVAPVADGALVIEQRITDHAVRAVPVGPDGQPRGAAQTLAPGGEDGTVGADEDAPKVVPGPVGATTATVLVAPTTLLTLGADGRPAAPARALPELDDGFIEGNGLDGGGLLVRRTDGTLLGVALDLTEVVGIDVRAIGADGRPADAGVTQRPLTGAGVVSGTVDAAVAADGRVLVAWIEQDRGGRGLVRAWAFDPQAPLARAPVTIGSYPGAGRPDLTLEADALLGGGWGLAWPDGTAGTGLSAVRLTSDGAPAGPSRRVTTRMPRADSDSPVLFALAGDTVAWVEQPVVGLPQVRAAPLP